MSAAPGSRPIAVVLARTASVVLTLAFAASSCAGEDVNRVRLVFRSDETGTVGFNCTEDSLPGGRDARMANRALPSCGGSGRISIVVDFVRMAGAARCGPGELIDWCTDQECLPMREHRFCVERTLPDVTPGAEAALAVTDVLESLSGQVVSGEVPEEYVSVRVVAVTTPCAELPDTLEFACPTIVGCAYSCPVLLERSSGEILVSLDLGAAPEPVRTGLCAPAVYSCASYRFAASSTCTSTATPCTEPGS